MLDTVLLVAAVGSCMNPGRAAAPSGGRSVAPHHRQAARSRGGGTSTQQRPWAAPCPLRRSLGAKWRGRAAILSAGHSIAAAPRTGRKVVEGHLYQAGQGTGRRGWLRSQLEAPPPPITLGKVATGLCGDCPVFLIRSRTPETPLPNHVEAQNE